MIAPSPLLDRAQEICWRVVEAPAADRSSVLADACGTDEPLSELVTRLLDVAPSSLEGFLEGTRAPITDVTWSEEATLAPTQYVGPVLSGTVGHYEVLERIGRGGGGAVYAARDRRLGRRVALKVLGAAHPDDQELRARTANEARVLASLNHPNIATVHAREEISGVSFIVQELIDGETLRDRLAGTTGREHGGQGRVDLTLRRRLEIARDVASALEAAHEVRVVHRDLKPANVMLTSRGRVKVLDFGIASLSGGASRAGDRAGTPGYMSPEQLRGERPEPSHDLWSFGCLLFELMSGSRAFPGESTFAIVRAALDGQVAWDRLAPDLTEAVRSLIARCLSPDAGDRPGAPSLQAALDAAIAALPPADTASLDRERTNLPASRDRFIGREREIAEISKHLTTDRLLTIVGMAGAGKTCLAVESARRALESFDDGVWLADLTTISGQGELSATVAAALGLDDRGARTADDQLAAHLAPRRTLLVLDNCEPNERACGELLARLLSSAPGLRVLATSRVPLGCADETLLPIPLMTVPAADDDTPARMGANEAVRLFVDRARRVAPTFALDEGNAPAIARLVRDLDGLPLAIELAAARTRVMSPTQMLARVTEKLAVLSGGEGERHDSLRTALDVSYELLEEDERDLVSDLSVFRGAWTLEAVERVCLPGADTQTSLDLIDGLVQKSWVVRVGNDAGDVRHGLLEIVREYAAEKLRARGGDAVRAARTRLFDYVERLALAPRRGKDGSRAVRRVAAELDNVRAALDETDPSIPPVRVAHLVARLAEVWYMNARWSEGHARCRTALETTALTDGVRGALCGWIGQFALGRGDLDESAAAFTEALAAGRRLGEPRDIGQALRYLGQTEEHRGRYDEALALYEEAVETLEDPESLAGALAGVAGIASYREDYVTAKTYYERALEETHRCGFHAGEAMLLGSLGGIAYHQGNFESALERYEDALDLNEEIGNRKGWAAMKANTGSALLALGRAEDARRAVREALAAIREMDNRVFAVDALALYGAVEAAVGNHDEAAQALGRVTAMRTAMGLPAPAASQRELDALSETLRRELGDRAFRRQLRRGERRDWRKIGADAR